MDFMYTCEVDEGSLAVSTETSLATVLDDDYVYNHVWPDSPAGDWLVNYADMTLEEIERYDL